MTVGENIRRLRKERGLTQKQLGKLCGINEVQIRRYELGGENSNPKIETIEKIANALGVYIEDIQEQYKISPEEKAIKNAGAGLDGLLAIITDVYEKAEWKLMDLDGKTESYILVGKDEEQFVLRDEDMFSLYDSTKSSIKFLIERMESRYTEKEMLDILAKKYHGEIQTISMKKY